MPTKRGGPDGKNIPGPAMVASAGSEAPPDDEAVAFAEAIRGARKLSGPARFTPAPLAVVPRRPPAKGAAATGKRVRASAEEFAALTVEEGAGSWTARADGVDRRVLRKLRAGDMALEGKLDLHGLTRSRAQVAVESFLAGARAGGHRCLLIVHGRGLHSGHEGPALGHAVRAVLTKGNQSGNVLACCTAPPHMGGDGATLVLLRR